MSLFWTLIGIGAVLFIVGIAGKLFGLALKVALWFIAIGLVVGLVSILFY